MAALSLEAVLGTVFARSPPKGQIAGLPFPTPCGRGYRPRPCGGLLSAPQRRPAHPRTGCPGAGDWVQPVPVLSAAWGQGLPPVPRPPTRVTTGRLSAEAGEGRGDSRPAPLVPKAQRVPTALCLGGRAAQPGQVGVGGPALPDPSRETAPPTLPLAGCVLTCPPSSVRPGGSSLPHGDAGPIGPGGRPFP